MTDIDLPSYRDHNRTELSHPEENKILLDESAQQQETV